MTLFFVAFVLVFAGAALVVRMAKHDPELWHQDPVTSSRLYRPNNIKMLPEGGDIASPIYEIDAVSLAETFDRMAAGFPAVSKLAGSPQEGMITYVEISTLMRFPDYISVKFIALEDGRSTLAVFSRSRFGYSDRGVNKARVNAWITALGKSIEG